MSVGVRKCQSLFSFCHLLTSTLVCHKASAHLKFANSTFFATSAWVLKFSAFLKQFLKFFKVFSSFLLPYLTIDHILQHFVYPIKDVTGEWYCFASRYFETYCFYIYLSNSFFINLYRYMCVVHANFLRNWSINIRVNTGCWKGSWPTQKIHGH